MGIYDRDWYRGEQKSPYETGNRKISREDAERLRRMVEGTPPNEPPKVDPKYRFDFTGNSTQNTNQPSNGYDPIYGRGGESSTAKRHDRSKSRGLTMKLSSFIILALVIGYVIAVGYNVTTVHNTFRDEKFWAKNNTAVTIEVATRLGLVQSLVILGSAISSKDSAWENPRVMRETINIVYDWYAPIQWSPVLSPSKELTWLLMKAGLDNSSQTNDSDYAYVKSNALNVRSGPSANNRVLVTLGMNSRVQVLNKTGAWWKIKYENIEGYVNSVYLRR